ncbi:AarF/ABC1/UbiB kinase family protein, partial [bacterium]|nr:AarF/ABC1/UbiB kinase family protein [bacterium]
PQPQDHVTPVSRDTIKSVICSELKIDELEETFSQFDSIPLATASIAQVHKAELRATGEKVIVKVQRPKIRMMIEQDLDVLSYVVSLLQDHFGDPNDPANWRDFLEEFIRNILRELDFGRELRMMIRFHAMFEDNEKIRIPGVYPECSTGKVLVQEYIGGKKIDGSKALDAYGVDSCEVGERLIRSFFHQVFKEGVFHADPHPGNLRILPDGAIVFLDFGMVGQLDSGNMMHLCRIFWGAGRGDYPLVARSLNKLCRGTILGVSDAMVMEIRDLVLAFRSRRLAEIDVSEFTTSLDEILRRHHLRFPSQMSMLFKSVVTLEQVCKSLHSSINLMDFLLPEIKSLIESQLEVKSLAAELSDRSFLLYDYLSELPDDLFVIIKNIQKAQHDSAASHKRSEIHFYILEKVLNRAILGVLLTGVLIGSSFLLATTKDSGGFLYYLGISGYLVAGAFAMVMIVSIMRSGPRE